MKLTDESLTRAFYNRMRQLYDGLADAGEDVVRERGLGLLALQRGEWVLEIGHATDNSLVHLGERVWPTGYVTGLDTPVEPPLPYPDEYFDAVWMSFTLEWFPEALIPTVLGEIRRVLRPNGRLGVVAMSVVEEGNKEGLFEQTYKWMRQHFPRIFDCRPIVVEPLIESAGFKIRDRHVMDMRSMPVTCFVGVRPRSGPAA